MSTHPFIPLYVDDYDAATAHLTPEEDGIYSRLIRLSWRTPGCSLPNEPVWIARKIRISAEDFDRIAKPVLEEFFTVHRGRLVQRRLKREYDEISRKKTARKQAGKKGGEAKARNLQDNASSNASDLPAHAGAFPKPEPKPEPELEIVAADDRADPIMWPCPDPPDGAYIDSLAEVLRQFASPCLNSASPKLFVLAPILSLGKPGSGPPCDFVADVLPAIQACAARAPPGSVKSWDYFVPAIREARDRRLRGAPAEGPVHANPPRPDDKLARREANNARAFAGAAAAAGQRWKP